MVLTHNHALFHTYLCHLSVVGGCRGSNKQMRALLSLGLDPPSAWLIGAADGRDKRDAELPYPCVTTESIASVLLWEGRELLCFVLFFSLGGCQNA